MNGILKEDIDKISNSITCINLLRNCSILVTGSTGLIGKLIVMTLLEMNRRYDLSLRVFAMARTELKMKSIFDITYLQDQALHVIYQDITQMINLSCPIDYVFHCAAPTNSRYFVTHPVETIDSIVEGTRNILNFSRTLGQTRKIIYLSSMEVYGICDDERSIKENYQGYINPIEVRSSYSMGKRMAECLCRSYCQEYHLPVVIARLSQTFGAGVLYDDERVFAQFARNVIQGEDIILRTEGHSTRSYLYTADAVNGLFFLLEKGVNGEAYTLTNSSTYISIRDLANLIIKLFGSKNQVRVELAKDIKQYGYNPETHLHLSSEKILSLGWKPQFDLEEMLRRLIFSMTDKI